MDISVFAFKLFIYSQGNVNTDSHGQHWTNVNIFLNPLLSNPGPIHDVSL